MPYDDIEQLEPGREADLLAQDALVRLVNYRPGVITEHFSTSDHCALRTLERFPRWQANRWETGYVVYLSQGKSVGTTGNGSTLAMAATRAILRLAGRVGH